MNFSKSKEINLTCSMHQYVLGCPYYMLFIKIFRVIFTSLIGLFDLFINRYSYFQLFTTVWLIQHVTNNMSSHSYY